MTDEQLAREGLEAWRRSATGAESWDEMPEPWRRHWLAATRRIKELVVEEYKAQLLEGLRHLSGSGS